LTFPQFTIAQSDTEFYTSQSGMALVGLAINRFSTLSSRIAEATRWIVTFTRRPSPNAHRVGILSLVKRGYIQVNLCSGLLLWPNN